MTWPGTGGPEQQGQGDAWGQQQPAPQEWGAGSPPFQPPTPGTWPAPGGGYGMPQPFEPPPKNNNTKILLIGLAVVLVIAGVVTALVVTKDKNDDTASGPTSSSAAESSSTAPSSTFSLPSTSRNRPTPNAGNQQATVPGWSPHLWGGAVWDTPANWEEKTDTFNSGKTFTKTMYKIGACAGRPTSFRAMARPWSTSTVDLAAGARELVQRIADTYYRDDKPQITMAAPHPTTDGTSQDYKATLTLTPVNDCDPPSAIVHAVVSKSDSEGTFGLLIVGDQQVPDAASEADLDRIALTVREPQ